ncbi:MAG: MFS transporter [Bacteroidetes bacterium]|nr:MAG: MFS transporter [Bacteroidota bacterium]
MKLNDKKVIRAWCTFDWANSVYSLVITSTIFPIYYSSVTTVNGSDIVNFFGLEIVNSVLYSYALSFSFLIIAAFLPLLTGIADYSGKKKTFMKVFTYIGGIACIALFFFDGPNVEFGIMAAVIASISYSGSLVFYNSFLPEIASYDQYDRISARGFSYGYVGSVLLLILNLAMIQQPQWFGITTTVLATKISFLLVGVWWVGFAQISFYYLPDNPYNKKSGSGYLFSGYREIKKVWQSLKALPTLKTFLVAFFFYNTGVQTILYLAALFADKELGMEGGELILTVLIIQIVAILGSYLFARISDFRGNKFSLIIMVIIWVFVCLTAYFVTHKNEFFILAAVVGMVMGGIQALSRATYSKLIPAQTTDHASYFSFYDVTFNISIVVGTFSYGLIEYITGSMRNSTLALGLFFIIGLGILAFIKIPRSSTSQ